MRRYARRRPPAARRGSAGTCRCASSPVAGPSPSTGGGSGLRPWPPGSAERVPLLSTAAGASKASGVTGPASTCSLGRHRGRARLRPRRRMRQLSRREPSGHAAGHAAGLAREYPFAWFGILATAAVVGRAGLRPASQRIRPAVDAFPAGQPAVCNARRSRIRMPGPTSRSGTSSRRGSPPPGGASLVAPSRTVP